MRLRWLPWGSLIFAGSVMSSCDFSAMSAAVSEASLALDAIFQRIDQGTWSETYETGTSPEFRQGLTKEDFDKLGRGFHDRLGKLSSRERKSYHVKSTNGVVTVDATDEAQFEKGKGTIRSTLRKVDGKWLIVGLWVGSPVFIESTDVPCASCGKPRPKDAAFCPACGKKVELSPTAPPEK